MTQPPVVSIVLPVYNVGLYLQESVNSILDQTFTSFELLILDDGSTDGCTDFLTHICDNRIRLFRRPHNYIATLNYGLSHARGKYIARMDADDRMLPTRLAEQVEVLEADDDIAICAGYMQRMGGGKVYDTGLQGKIFPFVHILLVGNFIAHPTVMLRTDYLRRHRLIYRRKYIYAEDYRLWAEIACLGGGLYVIPHALTDYRISPGQVSRVHHEEQRWVANRIRNNILEFMVLHRSGGYTSRLRKLLKIYAQFNDDGLLTDDEIFYSFYRLFVRIQAANDAPETDEGVLPSAV